MIVQLLFILSVLSTSLGHYVPLTYGQRPFYLVDDMIDTELKSMLKNCSSQLPQVTDFSIGHRGAALQFPEHTEESYVAAARMGAGIIECKYCILIRVACSVLIFHGSGIVKIINFETYPPNVILPSLCSQATWPLQKISSLFAVILSATCIPPLTSSSQTWRQSARSRSNQRRMTSPQARYAARPTWRWPSSRI